MFVQILIVLISIVLIYMGVTEGSTIDIVLGVTGLVCVGATLFAAITGSSLVEEYEKWKIKRTKEFSHQDNNQS